MMESLTVVPHGTKGFLCFHGKVPLLGKRKERLQRDLVRAGEAGRLTDGARKNDSTTFLLYLNATFLSSFSRRGAAL